MTVPRSVDGFYNDEYIANQETHDFLNNTHGRKVVIYDSTGNPASGALSTAPVCGQAKIAVTNTAVQLSSGALNNGVILTAKSSNAASIEVGISSVTTTVDGTGNGYILAAGASVSLAVNNVNTIYINGTSGDIVSWCGS